MSLLRYQEIIACDKNNKPIKKGAELLAWTEILDKLSVLYRLTDNIIKEREFTNIDYEMLDIIIKNKDAIKKMKEKYNLHFINMNFFPRTMEEISHNKELQDKLKELKDVVTSLEIIENIQNPISYLQKNAQGFKKNIKEELWFKLWLDDVTLSWLLEDDGNWFLIEELKHYIETNTISFIKIDMRLTNLIIKDIETRKKLFNTLFTEKLGLKWSKIIIEWIETKEELDVITDIIDENIEWIKKHNIKFYFQWYYFHKPEVLVN